MTRYFMSETPKNLPKKSCLEQRNESREIARYNVNVLKSIAFLYSSNAQLELDT